MRQAPAMDAEPGQALGGEARVIPVPGGQGSVNLFDPVGKHELECDEVVEAADWRVFLRLLKSVSVQNAW